jgi:transposase-like protein
MNVLPNSLSEAITFFAAPENCRVYVAGRRWPQGVECPVCGARRLYFDKARNGWECRTRHPRRRFTLKTGTIFEDSPVALDKWLVAVWMCANRGPTNREIAQAVGVTQKTAWFMLLRIRLASRLALVLNSGRP